jgi:Xaa-Pro aminopeptidase
MNDAKPERAGYATPLRELERRWALVRKAMKASGIDCLAIQNEIGAMGGYVRYFADTQANPYRTTVLFPADDDMLLINHGAPGRNVFPPYWTPRGIKGSVMLPYVQTFPFTENFAAEAAVKFFKESRFRKIGFVAMTSISASFYRHVTSSLPDVEFVDASDMVDAIKAVKGPDEIEIIMKTIALHDQVMAVVPQFFRPGRFEFEIRSDIIKLCHDLGSEEQNVMLGSHPTRSMMFPPPFESRKVQPGDVLTCLVEISGEEGFFAEVGRVLSLGEPTRDLQVAYETSLQAQRLVAGLMKPGADPVQIFEAGNAFLVSHGYQREERIAAHGQGYDMVERPAIAPGETMKLQENMLVAIHMGAHGPNGGASSTDNYLITADGAKLLTGTPQEIIIV